MTVLSPADPAESLRAVRAAAAVDGPVYIRLGFLSPLDGYEVPFTIGQAVTLRAGNDVALSPPAAASGRRSPCTTRSRRRAWRRACSTCTP